MPDHVLEMVLRVKALELSAPTDEENCAYCLSMMNGDMGDDLEVCEHWRRYKQVWRLTHEMHDCLPKEELDLLWADSDLQGKAGSAYMRAEWEASRDPRQGVPEGYVISHLWYALPEGYYAVPDPRAGVEEMTYWRRGEKRGKPDFTAWPAKARYGPRLSSWDEVPYEQGTKEAEYYLRAFFKVLSEPYRRAIVEAIAADPAAAAQRFAQWAVRCCICGRKLTHEASKVVGIGPECEKGVPKEVLANHFRPQVGELHAAHLAGS